MEFFMAFVIRRRPPSNGTFSHAFFIPFFSFAIDSHIYVYETDFILGPSQKSHF